MHSGRRTCVHRWGPLVAIVLLLCGVGGNVRAAQEGEAGNSERVSEVVATLASGRVTLIAAHDGLVIAAVGNEFEPEDLPPLIVPLGDRDLAVVLGAAEWTEPPPNPRTLLRLDRQLPRLIQGFSGNAPHLRSGTNVSNLQRVGLAILGPLREAARNLHAPIDLPQDMPVAEVLLVHLPEYGHPTVWDLTYWMHQRFLQENFWDTEVERPRSTELLPSKENRSGLLEVGYPPDDHSPSLLDWLSRPTGRPAQDIKTDPRLAKEQKRLAAGKARKVHLAQMVSLVRAALEAVAPASEPKALAQMDSNRGFSWIIRPPVSSKPKRPPGAPTLNPTH